MKNAGGGKITSELVSYFFPSRRRNSRGGSGRSVPPFPCVFTLISLVCLTGFAIASDSYRRPLGEDWRQCLGFAPVSLVSLQAYRILTCLVLTAGAGKFFASLVMLGFSVGMVESQVGTARTIKLFFTAHIAVLLIFSMLIVLPADYLGGSAAKLLANTYDVGPSAGYYGCLGGTIALYFNRQQLSFLAAGIVILAGRLCLSASGLAEDPSVVSADIAHLIALPLGWFATQRGYLQANGLNAN